MKFDDWREIAFQATKVHPTDVADAATSDLVSRADRWWVVFENQDRLRSHLELALVLIDTLTAPLHRYDAGASDNQLNWIVNGQKNRILEYRKRNNQKIDE